MADVSLEFLSSEIKISVPILIEKLSDIGILKNENDVISIAEKNALLDSLKDQKNTSCKTLIVQRKIRTTLNVSTVGGKNKSVHIEVRKKRTYVKNNINEEACLLHVKTQNTSPTNNKIVMKKIEKDIIQKNNKKEIIFPENIQNTALFSTSNEIKKTNSFQKDIKNTQLKKNVALYEKKSDVRKKVKLTINHWKNNKEEKKDYHLTTFLHARQAEDDNDREVEIDKKHRGRNFKKYRQKKHTKNHYDRKYNKEHTRVNIRHEKYDQQKHKSLLLQQIFQKPKSIINRDVVINETVTVADLADKMAIKSAEVIKNMMDMGIVGTINQVIDQETAQLIAEDMGHKVILQRDNELERSIMKDRDKGNNIFVVRPPVVTIMGHVDHGKTSLLDYIRSTKIIKDEAGGITQNIGAYHVKTSLGSITFLDTPGHSAFTEMRSRGVQITDIVILIVAADDGVMPQTIEAIQHAKEAKVPVIVAINKIDKSESNIDQVKNDLMKHEIIPEEWGGENIFVLISAKNGQGVDQLLSAILLQAEVLELKSVSTGMAEGVVIESCLDKGRGPLATVLVKKGTLRKGDVLLCGCEYGRIKILRDEMGSEVESAGPSIPVEVLGLSKVPLAGDMITVVRDEKKAREVAYYRQNKSRDYKLANQNRTSLENMFENINKNHISELKVILKSDVHGSLEAISGALVKLSTDEVKINIISSGIGGITETDASLSLASNAIIVGFNVRADASAKKIIDIENLDLRYYSVIYHLLDEVKLAMNGLLSPEYKQNIIGLAQVRNIFKSPKFGFVSGCMVIEGLMKRNSPIRVLRENIVVYEGELESLRRFKEDVNEVRNGMECGIAVKNYNDIHVNDIIEAFEMKEIKRTV